MCAFMVTSALSVPVWAAETTPSASPAVTSGANSSNTTATPKVTVKALKEKFADLIGELKQLKTDNDAVIAKNKAANDEIKSKWGTIKESLKDKTKAEKKAYLANLKTQVEPDRAAIKSLNSDITALRDQRKAQVANLKDAYKAKDETKISAALNSIIDFQKQIIAKHNLIVDNKNKILELLK